MSLTGFCLKSPIKLININININTDQCRLRRAWRTRWWCRRKWGPIAFSEHSCDAETTRILGGWKAIVVIRYTTDVYRLLSCPFNLTYANHAVHRCLSFVRRFRGARARLTGCAPMFWIVSARSKGTLFVDDMFWSPFGWQPLWHLCYKVTRWKRSFGIYLQHGDSRAEDGTRTRL